MAEIRGTTWADFEPVVDLLDTRSRETLGRSEVDTELVRRRWLLAGDTLALDSWVALADGQVVGHALLEQTQELGLAAADETTANELLERAEDRGRERAFARLAVTGDERDLPLYTALRTRGFALDREILRMWRTLNGDLPETRWPDGIRARAYEDADAGTVHALLDTAYRGWDDAYPARSHADWLAFMTAHDEFDPELWFVAERAGTPVACALHWRETEGNGWVKDLAVSIDERGRGLGAALLAHALNTYAARGATRVGLKVDSTNPTGAIALYRRNGFVTDRRYGVWVKPL